MFQKLEKVLRKIHQTKINRIFFTKIVFFLNILHAQIDQRFEVFDWEIIGNNESINSITEGYQYIFFATNANGVLRFNKFSKKFESNLYLGQGIRSDKIQHIYFDKNSGILWLAGNEGLEFSNSREGNWNIIDFNRFSINSFKSIDDIGSSRNFLWIKTRSNYIKLDHISGSFLGIYTYPDEKNIDWGDVNFSNTFFTKQLSLDDYFVEQGWLLGGSSASDNNGIFHKYTSYLKTENGFSWIGLSNGQLLFIDHFSKNIIPKTVGITVSIPLTISYENKVWIGGISNNQLNGISSIDSQLKDITNFLTSSYSGFSQAEFYSSEVIDDEVWFGSNGKVVIYNTRSDFFRTLGYEKGIPLKRVKFIEHLNGKVYIASSNDLVVVDSKTKKIISSSLSELIKKNNLYIDYFDIIDERLYFSINGRVYLFDNQEKINTEQFESFSKKGFKIDAIYGERELLFFSSRKGILNNVNEQLIPSSSYFNYKVNDAFLINNKLYIGTSGGLAIYDIENQKLNNFYDFSFIRNILRMELVDKFLVLLTSAGLVKLNLSL